ncbi:hypothetical protein ACWG0P_05635 [Amedibacillus sp. YH-ame6]
MKTVGKKNDTFRKIRYKALMGVMVFSIFVSCLMLHDINNTVLATDEVTEVAENTSPFGNVTINPGANIYYGDLLDGSVLTSVEGNTLLSQYTVPSKGDQASIDAAITEYKNSEFGDTQTDKIKNIFNNDGFKLPSITDIKKWNSVIPSVGGEYWLSDQKTETIFQHGYSAPPKEELLKVDVPMRGYANGNNTSPKNEKTISGMHENGAWFDSKLFNFGSYAHAGSSAINFAEFDQPEGYWYDPLGEAKFDYGENSGRLRGIAPVFGDRDKVEAGLDPTKYLRAYSTPECKPEDEVYVDIEANPSNPFDTAVAATYDPITDTYRFPKPGEIVKEGETLVRYYYEQDRYRKSMPHYIYKSTMSKEYKEKCRQLTGTVNLNVGLVGDDTFDYRFPDTQTYDTPVYVLYTKAPRDIEVFSKNSNITLRITGGMWYNPYERPIPASSIEVEEKEVRPKMNIDTSKVMFARNNMSNANATPNATLGAAPTTTLASGGKYKLVVKDDTLGVEGIYEGGTIEAEGGSAQFDGESTITVTPGTTKIRIPVATKMPITSGVYKVSAVSTGKDGNVKYGIVGDVEDEYSEIEIDISNLMDINQLTGTGNGKKITLYHEQLNKQAISDTISKDGKEYTIKVANPQTIDFTTTTKNALLTTTYPYGTEFEVSAEVANKGEFDLIDKTTPITFTVESEYLTQTGSNWNPETLTQTAKFKVVKPQNNANDDKLKIKINRAGTNKNDAALEVTSTKVKTEKRKIDLKIDSSIFDADKGSERISLKVQDKMPDITQKYKMYKEGTNVEDAVANGDKNKIPYSILTTHWIGDYVGDVANGVSKDKIPIENGKVLLSANGNIWKANITKGTDAEKNTWFDERYVVASTTPKDAIIDVYDRAGNGSSLKNEILYVNDIVMSLEEYKDKFVNASNQSDVLSKEGKWSLTNNTAPYNTVPFAINSGTGITDEKTHAGIYEVFNRTSTGSHLNSELTIVDNLVRDTTTGEELRANTYIHQKGNVWGVGTVKDGWDRLARIEYYDLKTGAKSDSEFKEWKLGKVTAWKELGETTLTIETIKGTKILSKIIVRDHAIITGDINVSANNLQLTVEEATDLVTQLGEKSKIQDKIDILTPADSKSKYGMYPYATNINTGNEVEISSISGLPKIESGKAVETGVYTVTFTTVSGEIVQPTITVYATDPVAYVSIPKKIKLEKSSESGIIASKSDKVELKVGMNTILKNMNNKIVVETQPTFTLAGTTGGNKETKITVNVYDSLNNELTSESNSYIPLATLDSTTTTVGFTLKVKKGLPYPGDRYSGLMTYKISFKVPLTGTAE